VFSVIMMSAAFITIFSASYFGALGYVLSFVSMYRLSSGSDSCSPSIATAASTTVSFWRELLFYVLDGRYGESPVFSKDIRKRSYLYFLSLILYLWNKPHYRFGTFEEDMIKNLRNVALPGTGVPLSWVACNRLTMVFLLFFRQPLLCLLYAAVLSKERSVLAITANCCCNQKKVFFTSGSIAASILPRPRLQAVR